LQRRPQPVGEGGRIEVALVRDEIERLEQSWQRPGAAKLTGTDELLSRYLSADALSTLDRVQLSDVLSVCAETKSLSEAGRALFAESRKRRSSQDDADRLRKYLARFGIRWADL
jgi:transcriptional regulatory protein RtcR